jgi:hypothetical protein
MQQQIITPQRRPVRRYDRSDLDRIERRECAYRVQGRASFGNAPNDSLIVGAAPSLTAATFDFDPRKGVRFGGGMKVTGTAPQVTVTGTRDRSQAQLLIGGIKFTVLSGGLTMDVSFDNGATTVDAGATIPAGSTYVPSGLNSDLIFTFPAGTYTAGSTEEITVERWTDQIGGYFAENSASFAQQPRYLVTGLSSLPCLDFDGTDDRITGTDSAVWTCFQNAPAFTLIQRLASDTPNAARVAFSVANSAQASNGSRRFGTNAVGTGRANSTYQNDAGSALALDAATNMGTNTARTHAWFSPGTTLGLDIDGVTDVTVNGSVACNPGTLTPNRYGFGCRVSSTAISFWDGKVGRHVGFNSNISDRAAWIAAL